MIQPEFMKTMNFKRIYQDRLSYLLKSDDHNDAQVKFRPGYQKNYYSQQCYDPIMLDVRYGMATNTPLDKSAGFEDYEMSNGNIAGYVVVNFFSRFRGFYFGLRPGRARDSCTVRTLLSLPLFPCSSRSPPYRRQCRCCLATKKKNSKDCLDRRYTRTAIQGQMAARALDRLIEGYTSKGTPFSLSVHFSAPHPPMVRSVFFAAAAAAAVAAVAPVAQGDTLLTEPLFLRCY